MLTKERCMRSASKISVAVAVLLIPALTSAANVSSGQNGNGNSANATTASYAAVQSGQATTTSTGGTATADTTTQVQSENRAENQVNNPDVGIMAQDQLEIRTEAQIQEIKPTYTPINEQATLRLNAVTNAAEELVRVSNRVENQGVGDQIREIAKVQTQNQDMVNQSLDKAETRTSFAKFFIGPNYTELKVAKTTMTQNQDKIQELKTLMDQVSAETDKLAIANQIISLNEQNLTLRDQLAQADSGFSLFGWLSRLIRKY